MIESRGCPIFEASRAKP